MALYLLSFERMDSEMNVGIATLCDRQNFRPGGSFYSSDGEVQAVIHFIPLDVTRNISYSTSSFANLESSEHYLHVTSSKFLAKLQNISLIPDGRALSPQ